MQGQDFPEEDHEAAVGDGEVAFLDGLAVGGVVGQIDEGRGGGDDDEMTGAVGDKFVEVAGEEPDAKDGLKGQGHFFLRVKGLFAAHRRAPLRADRVESK